MEPIQNAGFVIILSLQGLGDWMALPMQLISAMGYAGFYLLVLPALYWCFDAALGLRVAVCLLLSVWLNDTLKLVLHAPRPYWVNQRVRAIGKESTFGFPSGHAQHAMVMWGLLAASVNRPWAWIAALVMVFLIGLSRLYLGVHFLSDVVAGWAVGALLLFAFLRWQGAAASWLRSRPFAHQILVALVVSLALVALSGLSFSALAGWHMPQAWVQNVLAATGNLPHRPTPRNALLAAGTLLGMGVGAAWLDREGGFSTAGPLVKRLARYVLGLVGVVTLWVGLGMLLPHHETGWGYALGYARAALLGGWVAGGAPAGFIRLGLAKRRG
jgi:membrane-associated phospholipid phosphatase